MYSDCIHLCPQNLSYSLSIVTVCIILFIMAVIVIIVMRKARYGQFCCLKVVSCIHWCTYIHAQHYTTLIILLCTLIFIFTAENEIPIRVSLSWHTYSPCPRSPDLSHCIIIILLIPRVLLLMRLYDFYIYSEMRRQEGQGKETIRALQPTPSQR